MRSKLVNLNKLFRVKVCTTETAFYANEKFLISRFFYDMFTFKVSFNEKWFKSYINKFGVWKVEEKCFINVSCINDKLRTTVLKQLCEQRLMTSSELLMHSCFWCFCTGQFVCNSHLPTTKSVLSSWAIFSSFGGFAKHFQHSFHFQQTKTFPAPAYEATNMIQVFEFAPLNNYTDALDIM